ncbi:MAG: hypothetical protein KAI64_04810, partial [Thermoplasmata archaeon]|nr:hypothetical protein [Thermoplasmata archaeon]
WINITPVNDPPVFQPPPVLNVEVDKEFTFDYSPYISDVDNDLSELIMLAEDQFASVDGLEVTYLYPALMKDETVQVTLRVSDGIDEVSVNATIDIVSASVIQGLSWDSIMLVSFWGLILLGSILALFVFLPLVKGKKRQRAVEDIFLIHRDGRLIGHHSRLMTPERDEDVLSGMLTAVQEFVKDSLGREGAMRSSQFKIGDKNVIVERGNEVFLAVFTSGETPPHALSQMKTFVEDVEVVYAHAIPHWTGDVSEFRGLNDLMDVLFVGKGYTKGYWKKLKFLIPKPKKRLTEIPEGEIEHKVEDRVEGESEEGTEEKTKEDAERDIEDELEKLDKDWLS